MTEYQSSEKDKTTHTKSNAHNSFLSRNLVCIQTTMFRGFIKTKMQNNKEGLVVEDG